jgi:hypothetical protein
MITALAMAFLPVYANTARCGPQQAAQHADSGGLSCAVCAQKAEYLARGDRKAYVVNSGKISEFYCQVVNFYRRCIHFVFCALSFLRKQESMIEDKILLDPVVKPRDDGKLKPYFVP